MKGLVNVAKKKNKPVKHKPKEPKPWKKGNKAYWVQHPVDDAENDLIPELLEVKIVEVFKNDEIDIVVKSEYDEVERKFVKRINTGTKHRVQCYDIYRKIPNAANRMARESRRLIRGGTEGLFRAMATLQQTLER